MSIGKYKPLEEYREQTWLCMRCNYCQEVWSWYIKSWRFSQLCPSSYRYKWPAYTAMGRVNIARALIEGDMDWKDSEKMLEIIYACSTCSACEIQCLRLGPIEPLKIIEALRVKAVKLGIGPMPEHKRFARSIEENHNPYFEAHEERLKWMPSEIKSAIKADTAYFVGCTSSYRQMEIADATVKILRATGIDFTILHPEEWCCGSPLFRTGQIDLAKKQMEHNIKSIKNAEVKRVVTSCAGCYRTFKSDYPLFVEEIPFEVIHTTELISELIEDGKIEFKKLPKRRVTYHDPCHLAGHEGIYDQPRKILNTIPGIELVEMERIKDQVWCCGAGGGVKAAFPDFAIWSATERVEEAMATGATTLVSSCPFCTRNLKDAIDKTKSKIGFQDITEIIQKTIKMR